MKLKSALLFTAISLFSLLGNAQKTWTLTDCIDYAHANNIQIKRSQLQADLANADKLQAKTNLLPDINAEISRRYSFGRNVESFTNEIKESKFMNDNYGVNSSVSLFTGLRNFNNIKRTEFVSLAAIQNVEREKIEKTIEISTAYLDILYQQELKEVAISQREVTTLQVDRTAKLVEAGSVAKGDLLEIQAQLATENLNVINAENALQLSLLNLVQLLDLDSVGGFSIVTPDTIDPNLLNSELSVHEVYSAAMEFLPHIKSANYQLLSAEKDLAIQKGQLSPLVYLSAGINTGYSDQRTLSSDIINEAPIGYVQGNENQVVVRAVPGTMNYPYGDQIKDNIAQSLTLGVSIPIYNKGQVNTNISKARIRVEDSKYQLEQMKQQIYKNIQQAHNDAVSARQKFASASEAVNSYREAFHYTQQKYNVGIVNSVEYNIAKNNFIRAESQLLQAKYEYVFANKILDFYRGIPITL